MPSSWFKKNAISILQFIIFTVRFIEGISWGYSDQLPHDELDTQTLLSVRAFYCLVLKSKPYEPTTNADPQFHCYEHFLACFNYEVLDRLCTNSFDP